MFYAPFPFHSAGTATVAVTPSPDHLGLIVRTPAPLARMDLRRVCIALCFDVPTIIVRSTSVLRVGIVTGLGRTTDSGESAPASHKRIFSTIRPSIVDQPSQGLNLSDSYPHAWTLCDKTDYSQGFDTDSPALIHVSTIDRPPPGLRDSTRYEVHCSLWPSI